MAKFIKNPEVIEAITFDELVNHGLENGANVNNGMPWSWNYNGHPITHENDQCYLIPTLEGTCNMTPDDMLITGVKGEIYPCNIEIFEKQFSEKIESKQLSQLVTDMESAIKSDLRIPICAEKCVQIAMNYTEVETIALKSDRYELTMENDSLKNKNKELIEAVKMAMNLTRRTSDESFKAYDEFMTVATKIIKKHEDGKI